MPNPFSPQSVSRQLDNCTYCPKMCRHACPVSNANGHEPHTPQSKMDILNRLTKGDLQWTSDNCAPLFACTSCRQCTAYCQHDNEPGLVLLAGRALAQDNGVTHPQLKNYPNRFKNREERLRTKIIEQFADSPPALVGKTGFWPGCDAIDKGPGDVESALELFTSFKGDDVGLVRIPQICAGYPLLAAGHVDRFRQHAKQVATSLRPFQKIITNCSACLYTMHRQYPAEGIKLIPKVVSLPGYLAENIRQLPEKIDKKPVYYHDPCHLARYSGVVEQPRVVLSRIAELRDFSWSHSDTECCGGGGLLPKTDPHTADTMAKRRLREIASRGGGTVVTASATCSYMLKSNAPSGVRVVDLATYITETLCLTSRSVSVPSKRR